MPTKKMSKTDAKTLAEARKAISALTATLNQGYNRYDDYGRNCRASIASWEATIKRITGA